MSLDRCCVDSMSLDRCCNKTISALIDVDDERMSALIDVVMQECIKTRVYQDKMWSISRLSRHHQALVDTCLCLSTHHHAPVKLSVHTHTQSLSYKCLISSARP